METLCIPNENDFKKWVKEAVKEYFESVPDRQPMTNKKDDDLINRKEVAIRLAISLVTLTDWMKRGLPSHKQRGRVYFVKSEVLEYIRKNEYRNMRLNTDFLQLENNLI